MRIGDFRQSYAHDESIWPTAVQRAWLAVLLIALAVFPAVGGAYLVSLMCVLGIHVISALSLIHI